MIEQLWEVFDERYNRRRQRSMATVTKVSRDEHGKAYAARANIDGLGDIPVAIGYGQQISQGSRFETENIGTPSNPQWQIVRSVSPLAPPPSIAEVWEDWNPSSGNYVPGDLVAGDITGTGPNLYYDSTNGRLHLRKGSDPTISLYGDTGSARFGRTDNGVASLFFDAAAGDLSLTRKDSGGVEHTHFRVDGTGAFVSGRLTVTDVISNSLTDDWDNGDGFWLGVEGGEAFFRVGNTSGDHMYWDPTQGDGKLFITGEFEGDLAATVVIPASQVTVANANSYYGAGATDAETVFDTIGAWSLGEGNGIDLSTTALRNTPSIAVNQGYAFNWTAQHAYSPSVAQPPFTLAANAQGQTVVGFKADQLNKQVTGTSGLTGGGFLTTNQSLSVNKAFNFTGANKWTGSHTFDTGTVRFDGTLQADTDLDFIGAQQITTSADTLTIAPASDLLLSPGGNKMVKLQPDVALQSSNYASQVTGMRVTWAGEGDFRYLYTDELHAKAFIADLEQALAGGQIIAKSVTILAEDFQVPAAGAATNGTTYPHLKVKDLPSATGMQVFQSGDVIRLRQFSRSGGSLSITNCWGTVSSPVDNGDGTQSWTFTRSSSPNAGAMATDAIVEADAIVLDYGTTGNGFYEVNAIDGLNAANSPYMQVVTWSGHPHSGQTVRLRSGNLRGIFNVANEFGLYAGNGTANTDKYLRITNNAVEAHNLPVKLYDGNSLTISLDPTTLSFAMGSTLPDDYDTGAAGIWMGKDGATYKARIGDPAGNRVTWDGSNLNVVGTITVTGGNAATTDFSNVTANYAGSTSVGGNALDTDKVNNVAASTVSSGAQKANAGLDGSGNLTTKALPGSNVGTPAGSGLFLGADYMGYYGGSKWNSFLQSDGTFWLRGATDPTDTNKYHGLWWDPAASPHPKLHIYGDIFLAHTTGEGGDDHGPTLHVAEHGLISMESDGHFNMGSGSQFTAGAGSTFTIGASGGDGYLNWDGSTLTVEGVITVKDGSSILEDKYRPLFVDLIPVDVSNTSGSVQFFENDTSPYGRFGYVKTVGGNIYSLDQYAGADVIVSENEVVVVYTVKNGATETTAIGDAVTRYGVDDPEEREFDFGGFPVFVDFVSIFFETLDAYTASSNHIIIAHIILDAGRDDIVHVSTVAESRSTIIGPGYIRTDSLQAISANLGSITGGNATFTSGANKLWVNPDNGETGVVLAAGTTSGGYASANFRVNRDGTFHAGASGVNFVDWDGAVLTINGEINATGNSVFNGTIQATAGYFGGVNKVEINGDGIFVDTGKISWNSGVNYIAQNDIYIANSASGSILRIGNTAHDGLLDLDMYQSASYQWDYGIHIADGGNNSASGSALFHGESSISTGTPAGIDAIDRIFDAKTSGSALSDGFYADIANGDWNAGAPFNSKGAAFKGKTNNANAVAVFNQNIGDPLAVGAGAPAVWVGSNRQDATLLEMSGNPTNFNALNAGGGHALNLGKLRLKKKPGQPTTGTAYEDAWIWIENLTDIGDGILLKFAYLTNSGWRTGKFNVTFD